MRRSTLIGFITMTVLMLSPVVNAKPSWSQWVQTFRSEAIADGIDARFFDDLFRNLQPNQSVIHFDNTQPEKRLSFQKYLHTRASPDRIAIGRQEYKRHQVLLEDIGRHYQVDPCFIVSFWGMESSYGRFMGNFPVIRSLATLAYDNRRAEFFRKELKIALHILMDGHVSQDRFKGEWAGASGQPQFLPSSWQKYAVDYDHDGRKDIWSSHPDVFASIANYLVMNGWNANQPWALEVQLPGHFDMSQEGKDKPKSVSEWQRQGVRLSNGGALPHPELEAAIVQPYGGPTFLAYKNYRVIMTYNNSIYYAGAIGYMADSICRRR